jgi:hypothetical protein
VEQVPTAGRVSLQLEQFVDLDDIAQAAGALFLGEQGFEKVAGDGVGVLLGERQDLAPGSRRDIPGDQRSVK